MTPCFRSGLRAVIGLICIGFPSAYCGSPDNDMPTNIQAYLDKGIKIKDELMSGMPLVYPIIAPHAPYTCGQEGIQMCKDMAEKHGLGVHIHLCETFGEVKDWKAANSDETPVKYTPPPPILSSGPSARWRGRDVA